MTEPISVIVYYQQALSNVWIWLLIGLVVADLILGNIMAWTTKVYTSKKGISGFIKHFGILAVVLLILPLITAVMGSNSVPVWVTIYLDYLYGVSILETLAKMGVPIPSVVTDRLTQVVESKLKIEVEDKEKRLLEEFEVKAKEEVDSEGKPIPDSFEKEDV